MANKEEDHGNMRIISKSKIKNITATKKNFIENGGEVELKGENPHS